MPSRIGKATRTVIHELKRSQPRTSIYYGLDLGGPNQATYS